MAANDIERGLIAHYAAQVLEREELPLRAVRQIMYWLNDRHEMLGLPMPKALQRSLGNIYAGNFSPAEFERALRQTRARMVRDMRKLATEIGTPAPLFDNLKLLVKELGLPAESVEVLGLVAGYTRFDQVQYFCDCLTENVRPMSRALSLMTGHPVRDIDVLISPTGELVLAGLVQIEDGDELSGGNGRFVIPARVDAALDRAFPDFAALREVLLGTSLASNISKDDYDHVAADRDMIAALLKGAVDTGTSGVNILLYGAPGTGKTELTKVASAMSDVSLYAAGEEPAIEKEGDRSSRLADLVFSLRLLSETPRVALLFDEMEDIAWQLMRRGGSKVFLNRLLETNAIPVLWTSNNIDEIDPSLLRRMSLVVEMKLPPARQRERIVTRLVKRHGLRIKRADLQALAERVEATPAVLENAVRAAKLTGGGADAIERVANGIVRAVSGRTPRFDMLGSGFELQLMVTSQNLTELSERIIATDARAFSLCLSGPPGTGKSAFARHLAAKLGLEVVQKRASDLLGAFVGESEKRIAEAFEEAKESNAFLIFDEADSFLLDRSQATRSWEITQVNEMLTWMERHPYPVAFTTNLMDRLDAASLRRFTFHVRCDFMDAAALKRAYVLFFKMSRVPAGGLDLANLTPGDFAQVRRQAEVLGILGEPKRIVELLTETSRAKPGGFGKVGFGAGR